MRAWLPIAGLVVATAVLAVYVVRLQGDVQELSLLVGRTSESDEADSKKRRGAEAALLRRVEVLERELEATNGRVGLLHARQQLAAGAARAEEPEKTEKTKKEVLSILADETDRVLTKHLLWHRDNLMLARRPGFQQLVEHAGLTEVQSESVWRHLEEETDELVSLFRVPELREDPEALVREIRAIVETTDDRVRRVLDADQMKAYSAGRAMEQAALMPWLRQPQAGQR